MNNHELRRSDTRRNAQSARYAAIAISVSLGATCAHANLITNSSFAQNYAGWNQPNTPTVMYTIVTSSRDATNAARVDNRSGRDDAPRQNITAALNSAGPGATWTTRFWAQADLDTSVRCFISLTDANGFRMELLAESVLRTANTWQFVEGTWTTNWTPPLTSAVVSFRYETIAQPVNPGLELDDVSIELDTDGDQLTDIEEAQVGTDPTRRDSDGDGLPDTWESRNLLDPVTNDASLDSDSDGFDNNQEFWAATDPEDAGSYPGRPSNPALNTVASNVLRYLALLPSKGHTVVGQHLAYPAMPNDEYGSFIDGLFSATGHWPGLLALQYDDNANPVQVAAVNPFALSWWAAGGLVQIKWNPHNPWTQMSYNDRTFVSFAEVITSGNPANTNYMAQLVQIGDGLTELRDAGVVVLWRTCSEMNGGWFWWGRRDRQGYVDFWRHMYDYLVNQRGLDNLIWVYESDAGTHLGSASDYYYPGDDVVDVVGHNIYHDSWVLPFDSELLYRQYGKVYAIPQAGPAATRDGSWSNLTFLDGQPAGTGGILNRLPRLSYFGAWNSFWTWDPQTQMSVYRNLAIVDNQNALELMTHPRIVTRDDLDFSCNLPARVAPLLAVKSNTATAITFTWTDVADASQYLVLADPSPRGVFGVRAGTSTNGATGLQIPIPPPDMYYRVAGCGACGLGPAN